MAFFHRLILVALVMLGAWLPTSSFALVPTVLGPSESGVAAKYATLPGMCSYPSGCTAQRFEVLGGVIGTVPDKNSCSPSPANNTCLVIRATNALQSYLGTLTTGYVSVCPANSTLQITSCACNVGYSEDATHTGCVVPSSSPTNNCPSAGSSAGAWSGQSSAGTFFICDSTATSGDSNWPFCTAKVVFDVGVKIPPSTSYVYAGAGTYTHDKCFPAAGDGSGTGVGKQQPAGPVGVPGVVPSVSVNPCPNGQAGTVNGVTVCVPFQSDTGVTFGKSTSGTTTDTTGQSVTTSGTSTTTCTGGNCTVGTTTTTVTNGVSVTKTDSQVMPQGDYCRSNPNDKVCKDNGNSSFGGTCAAGFTCDGDAVQCALAREVYLQNCKLNTASVESALYESEKNKTGNQTLTLPGNSSYTFGAGNYNDSDAIGGAACIPDQSIVLFGRTVTLGNSGICQYTQMLRLMLLSVASIMWMVIVFKG